MIPPGIEPGTLSVLDSRDNRYTTESLPVELLTLCAFDLGDGQLSQKEFLHVMKNWKIRGMKVSDYYHPFKRCQFC